MARGGNRTPAKPAPVSGPGAQSRRTDGGAGQPARIPTGGDYGDRKALTEQQGAAPMASAGGSREPNPGTQTPQPQGPGGPPPPADMFGPTQRPGESPLAGMAGGPVMGPEDTDMALRAMYRNFPHPSILQLIRRQTEG